MQATQWTTITDRLNASFPGKELRAETAAQWFEELRPFDDGEVWLAVRRVRREQSNMPRSVAVFLDAIDANDRDQRAYRAELDRRHTDSDGHGTPAPPEFRQAAAVLKRRLAGDLDAATAKAMIDELAGQLDARLHARPPEAGDATRTCAECATSPVEGQVEHVRAPGHRDNPYPHPLAVYVPCPGCRPVRFAVLDSGGNQAMSLKTNADGWPLSWNRMPKGDLL
jgi:hypothetical protein